MSGEGPADLVICEDDPRYAALLGRILGRRQGLRLRATVHSGEEAVRVCETLRPRLLLLDLELPGIDGIEVTRRVVGRGEEEAPEILVLTSFADELRVFEAMRAGAAGYLVKGLAPAQLLEAVEQVLAGGTVIEARLARRFWRYFAAARGKRPGDHGLSAEELELLSVVARGLTNPEAARALGTSRRSVKSRLARIYRKLGVAGRVEATVKALEAGLIEL